MDSACALLLWQAWGKTLPTGLMLGEEQKALFARLSRFPPIPARQRHPLAFLDILGGFISETALDLWGLLLLWGGVLL
jgi:hypothetical protein